MTPAPWAALAILLAVGAQAVGDKPPLAFHLILARTSHTDLDSIRVIVTATNTGNVPIAGWARFDISGGYEPSAETFDRWRKIRDSALVNTPVENRVRDFYPFLPRDFIIPWGLTHSFKPLSLAPGHVISDTLAIGSSLAEFGQWPGFWSVRAALLFSPTSDTSQVSRLGEDMLRVNVPVP
jgi:hypothetical protein